MEHTQLALIDGDSMRDTLCTSDLVLLDLRTQRRRDGIYAIRQGEALLCKRIQFVGDILRVSSDNSHYPAFEANAEELSIVGRAVWFGRRV